jgi:arabinan endo-1,5-alpha-L-arabinosidase
MTSPPRLNRMKNFLIFCIVLVTSKAVAQRSSQVPVGTVLPIGQTSVHDPVMIKEGDRYYLFCTGRGISVWSSNDLKSWKKEAPVFAAPPQWAIDTIPGFTGHIWAPDISYYNGKYYLYYSVSAFGKNTSAIGVATNKTLNDSSPDFRWEDYGRVIQSYPGKTPWNAIDPNLVLDENQNPYLVFGSFWDGLKLLKLTKDFLKPSEPIDKLSTIASRKKNASDANPIEAPFIFRKGKWFYLFASIDYCCKGVNSTYKVIVGRSKELNGSYTDKNGVALQSGGGTVILQGNTEWHGVGHNGIYTDGDKDYIIYHGYDAADNGKSKLLIQELGWDKEGWPVVSNETIK